MSCRGAAQHLLQDDAPALLVAVDDGADRGVAAGAQVQLAHDGEQRRLLADHAAKRRKVVLEPVDGAALGWHRRPELPGRVVDDAGHQVLLAGEVVVQRGMVDPDLGGDVPQA
jgi:hypothetical protein